MWAENSDSLSSCVVVNTALPLELPPIHSLLPSLPHKTDRPIQATMHCPTPMEQALPLCAYPWRRQVNLLPCSNTFCPTPFTWKHIAACLHALHVGRRRLSGGVACSILHVPCAFTILFVLCVLAVENCFMPHTHLLMPCVFWGGYVHPCMPSFALPRWSWSLMPAHAMPCLPGGGGGTD